MITGIKKTWRGKVLFRISTQYYPDLWVPLKLTEAWVENGHCGSSIWRLAGVSGRKGEVPNARLTNLVAGLRGGVNFWPTRQVIAPIAFTGAHYS